MAKDEQDESDMPPASDASAVAPGARPRQPAWARDLRALYDSVVDEDLPDSFLDLLAKLDQAPE